MKVEHLPLDDLTPYAGNAKRHPPEQIALIRKSLDEYGWTAPLLVDAAGVVIAGHGRIEAAREAGLDTAPVIRLDDLTPEQVRAYRIADNRLAERGTWDYEAVLNELLALGEAGVDEALSGFSQKELDVMKDMFADKSQDNVPEDAAESVVKVGDTWTLGNSRLRCGDAACREDVDILFGERQAALICTSPPYADLRSYKNDVDRQDWTAMMSAVFRLAPLTEDAQAAVNLGAITRRGEVVEYWREWVGWMRREENWKWAAHYVWDKGCGLPGGWAAQGMLAPAHEWIFHFRRRKVPVPKTIPVQVDERGLQLTSKPFRQKDGTLKQATSPDAIGQPAKVHDSVFRLASAAGQRTDHPAVFPVALPVELIPLYAARGEVVYEPFSGSGTTLVAAARLERPCMAMEIAPAYCDIAIERWENETGGRARRVGGGGKSTTS